MAKKHFICTHTWVSPEARVEFLKMTSDITDREFFESVKTERAETLRHWMGKEDFFYCHWFAEDEDAIFDALEGIGGNDFMATLPIETERYVDSSDIKDQMLVNPYDD